ncbi:MAG: hypothetical protein WB622_02200, partial [Acidobacteriaceae bacterium]
RCGFMMGIGRDRAGQSHIEDELRLRGRRCKTIAQRRGTLLIDAWYLLCGGHRERSYLSYWVGLCEE